MPRDLHGGNSDEPVCGQDAAAADARTKRLVRQAKPFLNLKPGDESSREHSASVTRPFQFEQFSQRARRLPIEAALSGASSVRGDVELGRTRLDRREVATLAAGSLISLNALANEPVELFAQGRLIARAEVVIVDETPSLRIVEVL